MIGEHNALTVQTPQPNQRYEVSAEGPQSPYPIAYYGVSDHNGLHVDELVFTASGVYDVTVSADGERLSLTAKWE